jgi:hypothetical protein
VSVSLNRVKETFTDLPIDSSADLLRSLLLRNEAQPELGFLKLRIGRDTFLDFNTPAVSSRDNLKFNPERELSDAVPSGVAGARSENLSECALARRSRTLSQILARIIEVWVVGDIGKAALELQLKPLRELEVFSEPQGEVNGSGANERPHAGVAKTANDAAVGEA